MEEILLSRSYVYLEVNVKSKTSIGTKNDSKECELLYCKITGKFDEEKFQLVNSVYAETVYFSEVEKWERDDKQPNKKINLTLNRDIIFPPKDTAVMAQ